MKTNKYLLFPIILLLLTSCYIYKPYTEKEIEETVKNVNSESQIKSIRNTSNESAQKVKEQQGLVTRDEVETQMKKESERNQQLVEEAESSKSKHQLKADKSPFAGSDNSSRNNNTQKGEPAVGIKGKLQPNKYYKITALDNQYKIQVDKWDGDTLVSHKIRKPKKVYRHHMNDIQEEAILERRFSKPFSDLLTVGAYASGAAILLLLIL